jgi:hypothetical protein
MSRSGCVGPAGTSQSGAPQPGQFADVSGGPGRHGARASRRRGKLSSGSVRSRIAALERLAKGDKLLWNGCSWIDTVRRAHGEPVRPGADRLAVAIVLGSPELRAELGVAEDATEDQILDVARREGFQPAEVDWLKVAVHRVG